MSKKTKYSLLKKIAVTGTVLAGLAPVLSLADYSRLYFSKEGNNERSADLTVFYNGHPHRLTKALEKFSKFCREENKFFLISGVTEPEIKDQAAQTKKALPEKCHERVYIGTKALKTSGHPREIKELTKHLGIKEGHIDIVTSWYHVARSIYETRHYLGNAFTVTAESVDHTGQSLKTLLSQILDESFTVSASRLGAKEILGALGRYQDYDPAQDIRTLSGFKIPLPQHP